MLHSKKRFLDKNLKTIYMALYFIFHYIAVALETECERQVREAEAAGLVEGPTPTCDENGNFTIEQCHDSSGHCWCVDTETGLELLGTRRGPYEERVDCEGMILLEMALVCLYSLANVNKNRLLSEQTKPKMEGHGWLQLPPPPPHICYNLKYDKIFANYFTSFHLSNQTLRPLPRTRINVHPLHDFLDPSLKDNCKAILFSFGFWINRNLCNHDAACVCVCVCVCVMKHDISRREAWRDLIFAEVKFWKPCKHDISRR